MTKTILQFKSIQFVLAERENYESFQCYNLCRHDDITTLSVIDLETQ
jgi:hypothetical protein